MHSKKIRKQFYRYIDRVVDLPDVGPGDPIATIYGSDQVSIDLTNNRVKLPELGWMESEEVISTPKRRLSWVAVMVTEGEFYLTLEESGSPFSEQAKDFLPTKDGVIIAMPYGLSGLSAEAMFLDSLLVS